MASTVLYIISAVIAILLVLVAGIASAVSANDLTSLLNNTNLSKAHQLLTIGAVLGISGAVILIAMFVTSFFGGGFTYKETSEFVSTEVEIKKSGTSALQITIMVVLGLLIILSLVVGILAAFGASNIAKSGNTTVQNAYISAIVAAVTGFGGAGLLIVVLITYIAIRKARKTKTEKKFKTN